MNTLFAFDIDGVIADSYPPMVRGVNEVFNKNFCPDTNPMPYDPINHGHTDVPKEQFMQVFSDLVINGKIEPISGSMETLKDYYFTKTKRLVFITHRTSQPIIDATNEFLNKYLGIPFELYSCHGCEKHLVAKELDVTDFIDDHPEVIQKFVDHNMGGYLYDAQWHVFGFELGNLPILYSWKDIRRLIL